MTVGQNHSECCVSLPRGQTFPLYEEAVLLSRLARHFLCELRVACRGHQADAKRTLDVLSLVAEPGDTIVLEADGPESSEAVACLAEMVAHRSWADQDRLGVLGLLDLGASGPDALNSLGDLSPRDLLGVTGLVSRGAGIPEDLRSLETLPPHDQLGAWGLLG